MRRRSDRGLRLTLLSDYTALLVRQGQWEKVLQRAKEALRLVPNDPSWLATQQQAQERLSQRARTPSPALKSPQVELEKASLVPKKTKWEWI